LFNAAPGQVLQAEVEEWAKKWFPRQWAELQKSPLTITDNDMRIYEIDRSVAP